MRPFCHIEALKINIVLVLLHRGQWYHFLNAHYISCLKYLSSGLYQFVLCEINIQQCKLMCSACCQPTTLLDAGDACRWNLRHIRVQMQVYLIFGLSNQASSPNLRSSPRRSVSTWWVWLLKFWNYFYLSQGQKANDIFNRWGYRNDTKRIFNLVVHQLSTPMPILKKKRYSSKVVAVIKSSVGILLIGPCERISVKF